MMWYGVMFVQTIVRRPVREKGLEDWEVYDEVTTGTGISQPAHTAKPRNLEVSFTQSTSKAGLQT